MDLIAIYAITAGGIFAILFLVRALSILASSGHLFSLLVSQHLTLPFVIGRHRFLGPWTRAGVFLHLSYATINLFLVSFRITSLTGAAYLADLLGIKWNSCRKIHRATGWMAVALLSFHIVTVVQDQGFTFPLREQQNLCVMIAAISLGAFALHSIPWCRHWSYEIFLRGHQILAGLFVYGAWQHLSSESTSSKIYLLIALGTFALTLLLELITLLHHNGLFAGRGTPRVIVSFSASESKEGPVVNAVHIRVLLPRPMKVEAGQYINLWMPSVSLFSWMQTHPLTVTSWSKGKQDTVELLVKPRSGFTADLLRYALAAAGSSVSFLALFTGPHGVSEEASDYESILVLASGSGIAAAIPCLKKMIHSYNTCTSQARRLHLVWQVESVDQMTPALSLINNLLKDDIMDDGYILHISIYVSDGIEQNGLPFGRHKRVYIYQEVPDYQSIISLEASGDQVERLPNTWDEQGRTLVMVSTTDNLRDHIQNVVRVCLHQGVKLSELEYQPSTD
ncbi:hypothetical protein BDV41DRAFT_568620 [Aspergillus transmontanensis]|uniref:ferric-chelate reductase (NADPH) n=1 Tax=Aspergillus transmontanensis TaxID=1034304 RepID=A0A5N6VHM0_9EURO|nr:hypothetical protein BDV41DRAFT_568620 [Aspergillus transmontanensis]